MDLMLEVRPGRTLHVAVYNPPNTPPRATVFMIHGLGGRGAQWRDQIAALQDEYTLIVPDLLGHGDSLKPKPSEDNVYSFTEFITDLEFLFKKFAGNHNILLGHSYGGALAAFLAAHQREKVDKLILISPLRCQATNQIPFIYNLPLFIIKAFQPLLEKKFRAAAFNPETPKTLIITEGLAGKKNNSLAVIKALMQNLANIPYLDVAQLKIPALIISGETDKIISNMEMILYYQNLPQRQFEMIYKAGHMAMLEQAEEVNFFIKNFIFYPT